MIDYKAIVGRYRIMLFKQLKEEIAIAHLTNDAQVIDWLLKRNPSIEREPISNAVFDSLTDDYRQASEEGFRCYTKGGLPWFFVREGNKVLLVSTLIIPVMLYELI